MDTYMVTLADRETGQDQRILVRTNNPDNMQEWIDAKSGDFQPPLKFASPRVIGVRKLPMKRPHKTVLTTAVKVPA